LKNHPNFTAYVALICVCFFWGTTYLGIRVAMDSMGPGDVVCLRNFISGGLILTWAKLTGKALPKGRDLWRTGLFGALTIAVGNGAVALAEIWTPTGLASLFVATAPFQYAGVDALLPGGQKLHRPTVVGLTVGFLGVLTLVASPTIDLLKTGELSSGGGVVIGFMVLQVSGICWALGSLLQRNLRLGINPFVIAGTQQIAAAVTMIPFAILEPQAFHMTQQGMLAVVYLALFGGIVGYGCYMLSLSQLPLPIVSIYTYVNPAVAVFLGWLVLGEHFGMLEAIAMIVIFAGIWMVRRASAAKSSAAVK
jgi:drug/metabolite transporter (DMT)-like permease